jgi:hypothetical protein
MADLVDYLRDKLEHADDAMCSCSRVYVGWENPPETVRGRTNPRCPIHGDDPEIWVTTEPLSAFRDKRWWRRR